MARHDDHRFWMLVVDEAVVICAANVPPALFLQPGDNLRVFVSIPDMTPRLCALLCASMPKSQ